MQHFLIDASLVIRVLTYQMDNAGSCQPDRDKYGDELCQSGAERHYSHWQVCPSPDTRAGLQNVQILQNIWESH